MKLRVNSVLRLAAVGVAAAALSITACTPEPEPGSGGPWLEAGCIKGAQTGASVSPDIRFNGNANSRGNGTLSGSWSNGEFVVSADGSCSGLPFAATTLVRAADQGSATSACVLLGAGTDPAKAATGSGYSLPSDAWVCSETYFL